jgi:hypothetical protein
MSAPEPFTVAVTLPSELVTLVALPAAPVEPTSWLLHEPAEAPTVTVLESLPEPPVPEQVSVNVVVTDSAALVAVPLVAFDPDQPFEAVHDVAFVLLQVSCVVPPLVTLAGDTLRVTVGAPISVTVFESLPEPPAPVHVSVNVVVVVIGLLVALPLVASEPDQPPEAAQDVAFVLVQDSCVVAPLATLVGFAVRLTVGADGEPPEPVATWSKFAVLRDPGRCDVTARPAYTEAAMEIVVWPTSVQVVPSGEE